MTATAAIPVDTHDGTHDFDFLHGAWRIRNRKLRAPLAGSSDWYEFEGRAVERPLWDGQGNLEEYEATLPDGVHLRGLALRLYNPVAKQWTINWSSSTTGTLDPPMTGVFSDGVGSFYSHEDYKGRPIVVRFLWTSSGRDAARWEQAFSADDGASWETNWVMDFTRTGACEVVELRHYVLHPGQRDTLIALFDREFVETQDATGMPVIAQFRDIDRPNVFTWLRGFSGMPMRAASLAAFYDGPVWQTHKHSANATMISSDDVRLLRPVRPDSGFVLDEARPAPGSTDVPAGLIVATIYTLSPEVAAGFPALFDQRIAPRMAASGAVPFAIFETDASANTFPRLPVREGERAFVWFARFADLASYDRHVAAMANDASWSDEIQPMLEQQLSAPVEIWRLTPTSRSRSFAT